MTKRLRRIDRSALKRAIALTRAEAWQDVGEFCAMHCQMRSLQLKPWQWPLVLVLDIKASLRASPDDPHQEHDAAKLLQRMLAAGISRFDPDPLGSLDRAEAERIRA